MGIAPAKRIQVALFAKAPVPGYAKTRLIPALGRIGAARLHRQLILWTLNTVNKAQLGPLSLWCAPARDQRFFRALRRYLGVRCYTQQGHSLGERMAYTAESLMPQGGVLLICTDCPALTPAHLRTAAQMLQAKEAVLYPASDGGYVLLGLRVFHEGPFHHIQWGSASVLAETRKRLSQLGWDWWEGQTLHDIDEPDDLKYLPAALRVRRIKANVNPYEA
jgi:hypothetical protein